VLEFHSKNAQLIESFKHLTTVKHVITGPFATLHETTLVFHITFLSNCDRSFQPTCRGSQGTYWILTSAPFCPVKECNQHIN